MTKFRWRQHGEVHRITGNYIHPWYFYVMGHNKFYDMIPAYGVNTGEYTILLLFVCACKWLTPDKDQYAQSYGLQI